MDEPRGPTPRELEILKVLWEQGASSVRSVHRRFTAREDLAYNTVQTLLKLMANKGLVRATLEGRTYIYEAIYTRDESAVRFLERVYDGAAAELVQSLLRSEKISSGELTQMQALIDAARQRRAANERTGGHA